MKWIEPTRTLELARRNVTALLAKLDDPHSARTLIAPGGGVVVQAVDGGAAGRDVSAADGLVKLTRPEFADSGNRRRHRDGRCRNGARGV